MLTAESIGRGEYRSCSFRLHFDGHGRLSPSLAALKAIDQMYFFCRKVIMMAFIGANNQVDSTALLAPHVHMVASGAIMEAICACAENCGDLVMIAIKRNNEICAIHFHLVLHASLFAYIGRAGIVSCPAPFHAR